MNPYTTGNKPARIKKNKGEQIFFGVIGTLGFIVIIEQLFKLI